MLEKFKNLKNKNLIITFAVLVLVIVAVVITLIAVNRGANGETVEESSAEFGAAAETVTGRRKPFGSLFGDEEETTAARETTTAIKTETVTKDVVVGTTVVSDGGTTKVQEITSKVKETVTVVVTEPPRQETTAVQVTQRGPETTAPTTEPPTFSGETAQIDAFINGYYYIEANLTDDTGTAQPVKMAKRGSDLMIGMDAEGLNITMMISGGNMYLLDDSKKTYVELSQSFSDMLGFDPSELSGELSDLDFSNLDFVSKNRTTETSDGKEYTVYDYVTSDGMHLKSYLSGGNLEKIELSDSESPDDNMAMRINRFEYENLDRFFTHDGYTQSSLMDFAAAFEGLAE